MNAKRKLFVILLFASIMAVSTAATVIRAFAPSITTPKFNYLPGETVPINGAYFQADTSYAIPVMRPDGSIVKGDGSFTPGFDIIQADAVGSFTYNYKLDGIEGIYVVHVYASSWNGNWSVAPLALMSFKDANPAADLDQARNGAFDSPVSPIDWVNGNLGSQTAHYIEGYSIPYRCVMTDMPTGQPITLILAYKVKDSYNNALDYLTYFNRINDPLHQSVFGHSPEAIDPLAISNSLTTADKALISSTTTNFTIPTPPTLNTPVPGQPTGSYNNIVANEGINGEKMVLYGGTITNIAYDEPIADLSLQNVYQPIAVTVTLDGTTAVLAWGGHIASRDDWGFFPDGTPRSAGGISGSPYHMAIDGWNSSDPTTDKALGNLGAQDRSLSAVAVFAPPNPQIALTKTPSATKVENGSSVTYTYNATNIGEVQVTGNLTDNLYGVIFTNQVLAPNQSIISTRTVVLTANTTNIANFTAAAGSVTVNVTATATVTVIHPNITLTKEVSSTKVENGTSVTYRFNVTNNGDTPLSGVNVTDSKLGSIAGPLVLAPGAMQSFTRSVVLTTNTTNTATAVGVDQLGAQVSAQATQTVTVLHPKIALTKEVSSTKIENATSVTYRFNVTNTGDTTLNGVNVTDTQLGSVAGPLVLAQGAMQSFSRTTVLTANTTNTATAVGVDQLGTQVSAQATQTVTVLHPDITVTKSVNATKIENGAGVRYTFVVTNTGDTPLTVSLVDSVLGSLWSGKVMAPGASNTTIVDTTLTSNTTNIVTATGVDQLAKSVQDTDTQTVTVLHPNISVTKSVNATKVENGSGVRYTFVVTNTGDTPLTVSLSDSVLGALWSGKVMAPGASNTTIVDTTLTANTTNIVTATGVDQLAKSVQDTDTQTVTVLHPAITVTKSVNVTKIENGGGVRYTFVVTNTGDTPLTVSLVDSILGSLWSGKVMAPGASNTTIVDTTLTSNTTNIVTATGVDQLAKSVQDTDTQTVTVLHPAITVTKSVNATKIENGAGVRYTFVVTNTGDTPLTVSLVDSVLGSLWSGKVMAPAASNTTIVDTTLTVNTTNVVTATGVDQLAKSVQDTDTQTVTVLHPKIALTKEVSSTKVENGTSVTYRLNVTNTGDTTLTGVNITDNVIGSIAGPLVLAPGAMQSFSRTVTLTANTTNTATAVGVDQLGTQVSAQATQTVTVIHPDITVTKSANATKVENGAGVRYTFVVTNTGDTPLTVSLVDSVLGTLWTGKVMAPGASNTTIVDTTLTSNTTNVVTATGVDQLAKSVQDTDTQTVTVIHPQIGLTKQPSSSKVVNGSSVTYTFNVTNLGDTTLTGVNITDNVLGVIATNQVLTPGQRLQFTKSTILTVNTTNVGTAAGVDQLGKNATATGSTSVTVLHPAISVDKTCGPDNQLAPANINWTIVVKNTGDTILTSINVTDTRHGFVGVIFTLLPGQNVTYIIPELGLPPGTYYDNATAFAAFQLGRVSAWDDATCTVKPVFILKQFTGVTVLPDGRLAGYNATLVNGTQVNINGTKSGPYIYFNITYYFENSLNFLGSQFDGQAHNFSLWDKWGGNLLALGSPPVAFNPAKGSNLLTLADGSSFRIDPSLTGPGSYRGYIGNGLDISDLASQGQAFITMHLGDQQNTTNPGNGKGTSKDGASYDTDTVWYIGELGVNQSATLTLFIAPGKNPGGQLEFTSLGCTVINTGPRVRVYGDSFDNDDFLYAVERTNTLNVCVFPK